MREDPVKSVGSFDESEMNVLREGTGKTADSRIDTKSTRLTESTSVPQETAQIRIDDLISKCPQLAGNDSHSDLSEQCLSLLDSYFLDMRYVPFGGFLWLDLPDLISYRRIFENPRQDRDLVLAALQRTECQFETGDTIRPDLGESCHAKSFTAYTSFYQICNSGRRAIKPSEFDVDWTDFWKMPNPNRVDWLDEVLIPRATNDDGVFSALQHSRLREELLESSLLYKWFRLKCDDHDLDTLLFDPMNRDRERYDQVSTISKQLDMSLMMEFDGISEHLMKGLMYEALHGIAAHLGDKTASLLYTQTFGWVYGGRTENPSLVARNRELFPWMQHFYDAGSIWTYGSELANDPNPKEAFTKFLNRTIRGLVALDEAGVKYDLEMLVDQVCRRTPFFIKNGRDKIVSCQTAIDSLNSKESLGFKEGLMLDAFERAAVELGVVESMSKYEEKSNPFGGI